MQGLVLYKRKTNITQDPGRDSRSGLHTAAERITYSYFRKKKKKMNPTHVPYVFLSHASLPTRIKYPHMIELYPIIASWTYTARATEFTNKCNLAHIVGPRGPSAGVVRA